MKQQALLDQLQEHQTAVLAIMRGAEPLLRDPGLRDMAALARARWALMRALTGYGLLKHSRIVDPAIKRQAPGEAQRTARLKRACTAMDGEFRGYLMK